MESEFLDPDEAFEMQYADEFDTMMEMDCEKDGFGVQKNYEESSNLEKCSKRLFNVPDEVIPNQNIKNNVRDDLCSYKRSLHQIFGDIDDIEDEENHQAKKVRTETSDLLDHESFDIERILRERNRTKNQNRGYDIKDNYTFNSYDDSEIELSKRVPHWAFITIRNGSNERLYAKLNSVEKLQDQILSVSQQSTSSSLLSASFQEVMRCANTIIEEKLDRQNQTETVSKGLKVESNDLWVEKYKPSTYMELLSDEGTNRTLLQWIKLWDKITFGRDVKANNKPCVYNNKGTAFMRRTLPHLDEELDASGYPKHKIALLCGPPGLGKTTLAHIIAKQAGYRVVEMNASDDRSVDAFTNTLESTTQMESVMGYNARPNCLVIDEIDGAPQASIEILIKFAKGQESRKKKNAEKKCNKLKRPIICICNNMYVAALRALRQLAFVVNFPPTSLSRLSQRLIEITKLENIKTDSVAMMALCEKTNYDIRSCISTIYCLKGRSIELSMIRDVNVGFKDMKKGIFNVCKDIFHINTNIRGLNRREEMITRTHADISLKDRAGYVLNAVHSNGDYDRLAEGVYENFLTVKIRDTSMNAIAEGLKWFCYFDEIHTSVYSMQHFNLLSCLPYCFVAWHFLFSSHNNPKISYPSTFYQVYMKESKTKQIVHDVLRGMLPSVRTFSHYTSLLLDTLPTLMYIITPNIRPVSTQLYSSAEKELQHIVVNCMTDYNLQYIQERQEDGSYEFNIDPNIEEVVKLSSQTPWKVLAYAVKQMISRQIEAEQLRRTEMSTLKNFTPDFQTNEGMTKKGSNHLQKLMPVMKKIKEEISLPKDFFGRVLEKDLSSKPSEIDEIIKSNVWLHFQEGYSNAVRRTVYIRDLM